MDLDSSVWLGCNGIIYSEILISVRRNTLCASLAHITPAVRLALGYTHTHTHALVPLSL